MKLTWIIQRNLSDRDSERLTLACETHGNPVLQVTKYEDLDSIQNETPVIIYGGFGLTIPASRLNRFKPGVVLNSNLDFEIWTKHWKDLCLNKNSKISTVRGLFDLKLPIDKKLFIRPCLEGKQFSGSVMTIKEFNDWVFLTEMIAPESMESRIASNEPIGIAEEWRVFMVNGKASTGSLYQKGGHKDFKPLPDEVVNLANHAANIWTPAPLFTLDIARTASDELQIVEAGCINSSGFYGSDLIKLVKDINDYVELGNTDQSK